MENIINTIIQQPMTYKPQPKDGRTRGRRSFVFYDDTMSKIRYIAAANGVLIAEFVDGVLGQIVDEWESTHGPIDVATSMATPKLSMAVQTAANAEKLKRGNPHPSGRKPKQSKQ